MQRYYLIATTWLVILGACSSIKTYVEGTDATFGTTYAFVPIEKSTLDPASAVLYDEIRQRVVQEMQHRQFKLNTESPDMLIDFNILTEEQKKSPDPLTPSGVTGVCGPIPIPKGTGP